MKLQQKLLAALLAVAFTGGAHAAIDNSNSGNGSLFLGVIDTTGLVSAAFDLGISMDSFQPGTTAFTTWNLSAANYGTAWNQFVTGAGANLSGAKYLIGAMDSLGTAVGADRFLSTSSSDLSVAGNQPSNTQLLNFATNGTGGVDVFVNASNLLGTHGSQADGANYATSATGGNAYLGSAGGFGTAGKWAVSQSPFIAWGNVNTALDFYSFATSSTSGLAKATRVAYNDFTQDFYLNSTTGALTYGVAVAAIPEADTWAMFAAGLLVVGAIARRRMQA